MIWTNRVVFSNALRCFQNINSFFGLFWFLCTSIYRPCVVQTNQAQVNEVLEYNVRAVSRLFSDREAPSLRCHWFHAFHDWLEQCFICFKARTGLDASFIQLGGPRLTPAAEWCSVTWLNVGVSTYTYLPLCQTSSCTCFFSILSFLCSPVSLREFASLPLPPPSQCFWLGHVKTKPGTCAPILRPLCYPVTQSGLQYQYLISTNVCVFIADSCWEKSKVSRLLTYRIILLHT
jgi:hypothetical protein